MHVSAIEKSTGKQERIMISWEESSVSAEEIEALIRDAEMFAEEDDAQKEKADENHLLE